MYASGKFFKQRFAENTNLEFLGYIKQVISLFKFRPLRRISYNNFTKNVVVHIHAIYIIDVH